MKITALLSIVLLAMSSCFSPNKDANTKSTAIYLESEEFSKYNFPFSQAVTYGDIIYVSGQIGNEGLVVVEGGITQETRKTMMNIKAVLEQNGSSMENIIKCTCMLADISEWPKMNKEYIKFFPNHKPARSAFGTNGLALNARVEIECFAYLNK